MDIALESKRLKKPAAGAPSPAVEVTEFSNDVERTNEKIDS